MEYIPKILIVDDEINIIRVFKRLLKSYQIQLFVTTSGEEALQIITENKIDLIISDQRMPSMDGINLLTIIQNISPETIRILMSGYSDMDVFISAINDGSISHYITKPWENGKLIDVIMKALDTKFAIDEKELLFRKLLVGRNSLEEVSQFKIDLRKAFYINLLQEKIIVTADIVNEGNFLGIDLLESLFCFIIHINEFENRSHILVKDNSTISLIKDVTIFLNMLSEYHAFEYNENIVIVKKNISKEIDSNRQEVTKIKNILNNYYPDLKIRIGVSNTNCGTDSIKKCYNEAYCALVAIHQNPDKDEDISYYQDLGIMRLLININELPIVTEFVEEVIGKLIESDNAMEEDLLHTLEKVIICNDYKEAAESLFIPLKILISRKKRIEKILNVSLDNNETKMNLYFALKLHRIKKIEK